MNPTATQILCLLEILSCAAALTGLTRSKQIRQFSSLCAFLTVRLLSDAVLLALLEGSNRFIERGVAFRLYFYTYWSTYALEAVICLFVVVGVFRLAMAPLPGLRKLGMLVFHWAAAISLALALLIGASPQQSGMERTLAFITQLQQVSSVLTLCLLLFVCFAIRPMGLSFRSRIFGISIGLGTMSATSLSRSAWMAHSPHLDSIINVSEGIVGCVILLMWSAYFLLPEPRRRIIVLPTTSPFLRWNQISEVLGDEPGFVAIAGIPPELFAPAELEIMARASAKMPYRANEFQPVDDTVTMNSLIA